MERIAHKARGFDAATKWDIAQLRTLTRDERLAIAAELRVRAFGADNPDIRELGRSHASRSTLRRHR